MVTESPNTPIVLLNYYAWKSRLAYLWDASPEDRQGIEELQKSVSVVVKTQDDPMARLTLNQLALNLTRARDAHTGKDGAEIVIPIISVILQKLGKVYRQ